MTMENGRFIDSRGLPTAATPRQEAVYPQNLQQEIRPRPLFAPEPPLTLEDREIIQARKERYLQTIGRQDVKDVVTEKTPIAIYSMECYRHDMPAQGGLGMVVGDWSYIYKKLGVPVTINSPFYNIELHQQLDSNYWQKEVEVRVTPEERGFARMHEVDVRLNSRTHKNFEVPMYEKVEQNLTIRAPYHEDIKDVYNGDTNSGHRMFQEIIEGFASHQTEKQLGENPPVYLLNEAPVVFAAIAELDYLKKQGKSFESARSAVKAKSIYINHTLVQAVEGEFSSDMFEELVYPNIHDEEIKNWVKGMFKNGGIKLSTIAIELSDKKRGVSLLHSQEASKMFRDRNGELVEFGNNTNGISAERWAHPELFELYTESDAMDEFEYYPENYRDRIFALDSQKLWDAKEAAGQDFREALKDMRDQHGKSIDLPQDALIVGSARRFAGYKRPGMPFQDPDRLAQILLDNNAHFFFSGKAHSKDIPMKYELQRILQLIDDHPILRQRVHYLQDYNESVSKPLIRASHVWVNNPTVHDEEWNPISTEADGTSKDKAALNNAIQVSTEDGGMKDPAIIEEMTGKSLVDGDCAPYYLRVGGKNAQEELDSLYTQIDRALKITRGLDPDMKWDRAVKRQLAANWPIISGGRWIRDELNFALPKEELQGSTETMNPGTQYTVAA